MDSRPRARAVFSTQLSLPSGWLRITLRRITSKSACVSGLFTSFTQSRDSGSGQSLRIARCSRAPETRGLPVTHLDVP